MGICGLWSDTLAWTTVTSWFPPGHHLTSVTDQYQHNHHHHHQFINVIIICHLSLMNIIRYPDNFETEVQCFWNEMDGNLISNLIHGKQLQPKHFTLITISTSIDNIINHHHVIVMIAPLTYSNNPPKYQRHKCHI